MKIFLPLLMLVHTSVWQVKSEYKDQALYTGKTSYHAARNLFNEYLEGTHPSQLPSQTPTVPLTRPQSPSESHDNGESNESDLPDQRMLFPQQCKPKQLSVLLRHGTRNPSRGDVKRIGKMMEKIKEMKLLGKYDELKSWNNNFTSANVMKLTESGEKENENISTRYATRFPLLFQASIADPLSYNFELMSSNTERAIASAKAFTDGISKLFSIDASALKSKISLRNDILRFYENCSRYQYSVDADYVRDKSMAEFNKFRRGPEMSQVATSMSVRMSSSGDENLLSVDDVKTIWVICAFETAIHGPGHSSLWCDPFTPEESRVLEYTHDLKSYWKRGYGYTINYEQSCPLLTDIFQNFQEIIANQSAPGVSLYFGHSETLYPIYSLLGLFLDDQPLLATNYLHHKYSRKFRGSIIGPFAANIGFVLYDCEEGAQSSHPTWPENLESNMLQILVNEQPMPLPFTNRLAVSLQEFENQYYQYVHHCEFDRLCNNPSASKVSPHEEL